MKTIHFIGILIITVSLLLLCSCQDNVKEECSKGYFLYQTKKFDHAIEIFTKIIESRRDTNYLDTAYFGRAQCYFCLQKYQLVLNDLASIRNNSRAYKEIYYAFLSSYSYINKKYSEAIKFIDTAILLSTPNEQRENLLQLRGEYKYTLGDFVGAKADSVNAKKYCKLVNPLKALKSYSKIK